MAIYNTHTNITEMDLFSLAAATHLAGIIVLFAQFG